MFVNKIRLFIILFVILVIDTILLVKGETIWIIQFLAECLTECVSSYAGIDSYNRQEYVVKRGYDILERELKIKDYLVNIVKCVNKCVFNKDVLN